MKNVITSTHFRRPEYSEQSIRAVALQPLANQCHYHASIDRGPDSARIETELRKYEGYFRSFSVDHRTAKPSCNDNTKASLVAAQKLNPDFVILVEDDVVMGRDALAYFMENAKVFADDKTVFTISAWRHPDGWLPESGRPYEWRDILGIGRNQWFVPWGWGTWPDRLAEMIDKWTTGSDHSGDHNCESWDRVLGLPNGTRGNRYEVQPMISRACNIGAEKGTHRGDVPLSYWIGPV